MKTHDGDLDIVNYLTSEFDQKFKTVKKNGQKISFSVDIILRDLLDSGLRPTEALQVLEDIHPYLYEGIAINKIIKLINQSFQQHDWDVKFWKQNYLQPIIIEFEDGRKEIFNYKGIKDFLQQTLDKYQYTSKTFKAISDEFYRIILSIRTDKLQSSVLQNMVPSVLRNIIGINPFSSQRFESDYRTVIKLTNSLQNTWSVIPHQEKLVNLFTLFESFFKIVLVSFNYLPGYDLKSTITQINQLMADRAEREQAILTDHQFHLVGQSGREIKPLLEHDNPKLDLVWIERLEAIQDVVEILIEEGNIVWLIVIDQAGNELFARFVAERDKRYKSLIGMAISGVQSIVNELTDKSIKQIEQDEGSILIERMDLFSIVTMVEKVTPTIKRSLEQLAEYINVDLRNNFKNFNGNISEFERLINNYLDMHMDLLFRST